MSVGLVRFSPDGIIIGQDWSGMRTPKAMARNCVVRGSVATRDPIVVVSGLPYVIRLLLVVVLGGIAAGLVGALMAVALVAVQGLAFGVSSPHLLDQIRHAALWRRFAGPSAIVLIAGLGWYWFRRSGATPGVDKAAYQPGTMHIRRSFFDAFLQIAVVGSGASIGREGAPRQAAGALLDRLACWCGLRSDDAGLLIAAGAGAGLAAVYNTPLAGVAFALEIIWVRCTWRDLALTLPVSAIATIVAWLVTKNRPTYSYPQLVFSWWFLAVAGVLILAGAILGWAFRALMEVCARRQIWDSIWVIPGVVFAALLVLIVGLWRPEIAGNGKDLVQIAFEASAPVAVWALLLFAKPLATALCLRCGMAGGLLTPALATGAALGALVAIGSGAIGVAIPVPLAALLGASAVLAIGQNAPIFAMLFALELTHAPLWMMPLLILTTAGAWALSGYLSGKPRRSRPSS